MVGNEPLHLTASKYHILVMSHQAAGQESTALDQQARRFWTLDEFDPIHTIEAASLICTRSENLNSQFIPWDSTLVSKRFAASHAEGEGNYSVVIQKMESLPRAFFFYSLQNVTGQNFLMVCWKS